jgi:hypothetical protein
MAKRMPFKFNPKMAKRHGRLRRMLRNGTIKPLSKAEMRKAGEIVR